MTRSARRQAALAIAFLALAGATLFMLVPRDGRGEDAGAAATPEEEARLIVANDQALRQQIDAWRSGGDPPSVPPPDELMQAADFLQDEVRSLAARSRAEAAAVIAAVRTVQPEPLAARGAANEALAADLKDLVAAARKLKRLNAGHGNRKLKTGEPPPLAELVAHYSKAQRRYGIHPRILAAIHHVETKFGRVKSKSVAGATGPMQFIPSTWKIYGRGGNIQDPHDAIQAAARLLRANGAPGNYPRALHAYNPSKLYVGSVQLYAGVVARNPYALYYLYCWGP